MVVSRIVAMRLPCTADDDNIYEKILAGATWVRKHAMNAVAAMMKSSAAEKKKWNQLGVETFASKMIQDS
jgi:hypothetical protein